MNNIRFKWYFLLFCLHRSFYIHFTYVQKLLKYSYISICLASEKVSMLVWSNIKFRICSGHQYCRRRLVSSINSRITRLQNNEISSCMVERTEVEPLDSGLITFLKFYRAQKKRTLQRTYKTRFFPHTLPVFQGASNNRKTTLNSSKNQLNRAFGGNKQQIATFLLLNFSTLFIKYMVNQHSFSG